MIQILSYLVQRLSKIKQPDAFQRRRCLVVGALSWGPWEDTNSLRRNSSNHT